MTKEWVGKEINRVSPNDLGILFLPCFFFAWYTSNAPT